MNKNLKKGLSALLIIIFCAAATVVVPSSAKMNSKEAAAQNKNAVKDTVKIIAGINNIINSEILAMPKVYTLPVDLSPAPTPNPKNYNGDEYQDETIHVKCWHERIKIDDKKTVTANFADITVAHPTQIRTAFAGGKYGTTKRSHASAIAAANNAIVAVNADFYNCRSDGLIIRQGTLYRKKAFGVDTLFIDSNGDMSVVYDVNAISDGYYKKHDIYNTLAFGPQLVADGKPLKKLGNFKSISCGPRADNPRTAIGQLGHLHYLICTVDGRTDDSEGVTTNQLAVIMADKKCTIAYNLDGGQSSTMIFNNKLYNVVSNGGERTMSDIIYFATAIPESEWQ